VVAEEVVKVLQKFSKKENCDSWNEMLIMFTLLYQQTALKYR